MDEINSFFPRVISILPVHLLVTGPRGVSYTILQVLDGLIKFGNRARNSAYQQMPPAEGRATDSHNNPSLSEALHGHEGIYSFATAGVENGLPRDRNPSQTSHRERSKDRSTILGRPVSPPPLHSSPRPSKKTGKILAEVQYLTLSYSRAPSLPFHRPRWL